MRPLTTIAANPKASKSAQALAAFTAKAATAAAAALMALTGCGPRITNKNLAVVNAQFEAAENANAQFQAADKNPKAGVSPKEVESVLGQPSRVESGKIPLETQKKEVEVVRYYYEQDGQTIVMHFVDNKLISPAPLLKPKGQASVPDNELENTAKSSHPTH